MTAERDSMTLNEVALPALGVEERSDEAPRAGRARPTPDPEVVAKPKRRQFTAQYRLQILEEADRCTQPGEVVVEPLDHDADPRRDQVSGTSHHVHQYQHLGRFLLRVARQHDGFADVRVELVRRLPESLRAGKHDRQTLADESKPLSFRHLAQTACLPETDAGCSTCHSCHPPSAPPALVGARRRNSIDSNPPTHLATSMRSPIAQRPERMLQGSPLTGGRTRSRCRLAPDLRLLPGSP